MKMTKIVLASLLSVSLLGASTSVFAADGETKTSFEVSGGSLDLTDYTNTLEFGSVKVSQLVGANKETGLNVPAADNQKFSATVTDTKGDVNSGWTLSAKYNPLTGADGKTKLAEKLNIGSATLTEGDTAAVVFGAKATDVADALSKASGVLKTADTAVSLNVPAKGVAAQKYNGSIEWTLTAAPDADANGANAASNAVPAAQAQ